MYIHVYVYACILAVLVVYACGIVACDDNIVIKITRVVAESSLEMNWTCAVHSFLSSYLPSLSPPPSLFYPPPLPPFLSSSLPPSPSSALPPSPSPSLGTLQSLTVARCRCGMLLVIRKTLLPSPSTVPTLASMMTLCAWSGLKTRGKPRREWRGRGEGSEGEGVRGVRGKGEGSGGEGVRGVRGKG